MDLHSPWSGMTPEFDVLILFNSVVCLPGADQHFSFSGWNTVDQAIAEGRTVPGMPSYLTIGGGNHNGVWNIQILNQLKNDLHKIKQNGYSGIAYDIEECSELILPSYFSSSFAAAKQNGLDVLVTVSHSAPYGCSNKVELMHSILADPNVDYQSPQLYTTGYEVAPDFVADGVSWADYRAMHPNQSFVPSIVRDSQFPEVEAYFNNMGIRSVGFVQWEQVSGGGGGDQSVRCGVNWSDANSYCKTLCPNRVDSDCPSGEQCFASLSTSPCN